MDKKNITIGIFDSGLGGTSIQKEIKKALPNINIIYLADTKNFPYGNKTFKKLKEIAIENTKYLISKGAKLIVVACNTATVVAIKTLRNTFPNISFVGVEPAVKPAGLIAKKGIIILSSPKATKSVQLKILIQKFVKKVEVINIGSLDLVLAIEQNKGKNDINKILNRIFPKKVLSKTDVLVLGCTHFPLIKGLIKKHVGPKIKVVDSGAAVARRVKNQLKLINKS
jgi:glutamate racemase